MFLGKQTFQLYQSSLKAGLCEVHRKEFVCPDNLNDQQNVEFFSELQRKALLFIRLEVYDNFAAKNFKTENPAGNNSLPTSFSVFHLLDSVVVYILCRFSTVCCAGYVFSCHQDQCDNLQRFLLREPVEDNYLNLIIKNLKRNFHDVQESLLSDCLYSLSSAVKSRCAHLKLSSAIQILDKSLNQSSTEGSNWYTISKEAYKEKSMEEALKAIKSAINFCPYNRLFLDFQSKLYSELKHFNQAAASAYVLLMVNPEFLEGYKSLASSLKSLGYSEAHDQILKNTKALFDKVLHKNMPICSNSTEGALVENGEDNNMTEVPPLLESSDSEDDTMNVQSQESNYQNPSGSQSNKKPAKNQKSSSPRKELHMNTQSVECVNQTKKQEYEEAPLKTFKDLLVSLKEASQTLMEDCGHLPMRIFQEALDLIKNHPKIFKFEECDIVCIKYACGMAYYKSGGFEDLERSITIFKEILAYHKSINFPAVHYGIGLAYHKLNRYKEAIHYLDIVNNILNKNIHFKVYTWPGMAIVIKETKSTYLRDLVVSLMQECQNPPVPDAQCRFIDCPTLPTIYYNAPDFKGFYSTKCSEQCLLQYHPKCWKTLKTSYTRTDKEFLDQTCFTPDCEGTIILVQSTSKNGTIDKMFESSECKKSAKPKKSKLEKKLVLKEERRRRRQDSAKSDSAEPSKDSSKLSIEPEQTKQKALENDNNAGEMIPLIVTADTSKELMPPPPPPFVPLVSSLSPDAKPFKIIKKEKIQDETPVKVNKKAKETKKQKTILSADEFFDSSLISNYQQASRSEKNQCLVQYEEPCDFSNGFSGNDMAQSLLQSWQGTAYQNPYAQTTLLQSPEGNVLSECTQKNLYKFFEELLTLEGPLHLQDPVLLKKISRLSIEQNSLLADFNGVADFLKQNMDFAIVKDVYICLTSDVSRAYDMYQKNIIEASNDVERFDRNYVNNSLFNGMDLNPDAHEYRPINVCNGGYSSSDEFVNDNHEAPSLISAIEQMRQPLAVDDKTNGSCSEKFNAGTETPSNHSKTLPLEHRILQCADSVAMYFSEDMEPYRSYVDVYIKPYRIINPGKMKNRSLQTEKVTTVSVGTSKTDDELQTIQDHAVSLKVDIINLGKEKQLVEDRLNSAYDANKKLQNLSSIEIIRLRKSLEDTSKEFEDLKTLFASKQLVWDSTKKSLCAKIQSLQENNVSQKSEQDKLHYINQKLQEDIRVKELEYQELLSEKGLINQSLNLEKDVNEKFTKKCEEEKGILMQRVTSLELRYLYFKKEQHLKNIDAKICEAVKNYKDVELGCKMYMHNIHPILGDMLKNILQHKNHIESIRAEFVNKIDKLIQEVKNGTSLTELNDIVLKDLPAIPTLDSKTLEKYKSMSQMMPMNAPLAASNPVVKLSPKEFSPITENPTVGAMAASGAIPKFSKQPLEISDSALPRPLTEDIRRTVSLSKGDIAAASTVGKVSESQDNKSLELGYNVAKPKQVSAPLSTTGFQSHNAQSTFINKQVPLVPSASVAFQHENPPSTFIHSKQVQVAPNASATFKPQNPPTAQPEAKNNYAKLLIKLRLKHPDYSDEKLASLIKQLRERRQKGLSGLAVDDIIRQISDMIISEKASAAFQVRASAVKNGPRTLVNRKLTPNGPQEGTETTSDTTSQKKNPWGITNDSKKWEGGDTLGECCICFEIMTKSTASKADCNHTFHSKCLKTWLNTKSICPICRTHLLLHEDFPKL